MQIILKMGHPMNNEIKAYITLEAKVGAAFNFFINGMVSALIYHKADVVPVDAVSLTIDFLITCLCICLITSFFVKISLRNTKTMGILPPYNRLHYTLGRLFRRTVLFDVLLGLITALLLFVATAPVFTALGLRMLPFGWYIFFKTFYCAILGSSVTIIEMISGMCKTE